MCRVDHNPLGFRPFAGQSGEFIAFDRPRPVPETAFTDMGGAPVAIADFRGRVVVLNFGRKIAEGKPDDVQKDAQVQAAYLGSDSDDEFMQAALQA